MSDPLATARERAASAAAEVVLLSASDPATRTAVADLVASGRALFVHDDVMVALRELCETRAPAEKLAPVELDRRARAHAGDLASYGTWVFYPWSARLVRVLPEAEFEELRTSRNRNKITREEQTKLGRLRVGVVGLSVGQSTALTLALEGVGGHFRLADFDTLNLSNMNRLRAGVHEIGVNKAIITAREILEINPYAKVQLFRDGITDSTIDAFFGGDAPLDLLFEECDDLKMKFVLRREARRRGIPVLMETSDRGLLDVERFDQEPGRPLFHGLVGDVEPEKLAGMTTQEKVPIILAILGADTMSTRLAASLVDVEATLKTWPQLASAVALGGAVNTDAARRLALGGFRSSGRYYVDIEEIVADPENEGAETPISIPPPAPSVGHAPASPPPSRSAPGPVVVAPSVVETLVKHAALAPSGGNCQPWSFTYQNGTIRCHHDRARSESFLDFEDRATHMAFGALAENFRLSAAAQCVALELVPFPVPGAPLVVCDVHLRGTASSPPSAEVVRLAAQIETRVTNRKLGARIPLPDDDAMALRAIAGATRPDSGVGLTIVRSSEALAELGEVLGLGDRVRFLSPIMHREMMGEMRWTQADAERTRDGLDLATLELSAVDAAAMKLLKNWRIMETLGAVGGGEGLAQPSRKAMAAASAFGLVTASTSGSDDASRRRAYFAGGSAMQRVWLEATARGWAVQPMTAILYLFARLEAGNGSGLDSRERSELQRLAERFRSAVHGTPSRPHESGYVEVFAFRIAKAGPPSARALRRRLPDILRVER